MGVRASASTCRQPATVLVFVNDAARRFAVAFGHHWTKPARDGRLATGRGGGGNAAVHGTSRASTTSGSSGTRAISKPSLRMNASIGALSAKI